MPGTAAKTDDRAARKAGGKRVEQGQEKKLAPKSTVPKDLMASQQEEQVPARGAVAWKQAAPEQKPVQPEPQKTLGKSRELGAKPTAKKMLRELHEQEQCTPP